MRVERSCVGSAIQQERNQPLINLLMSELCFGSGQDGSRWTYLVAHLRHGRAIFQVVLRQAEQERQTRPS